MIKKIVFTTIKYFVMTIICLIAIIFLFMPPRPKGLKPRRLVAEIRASQRVMATAIESYYVDNKSYPASSIDPTKNLFGKYIKKAPELARQPTFMINTHATEKFRTLTTPIDYIDNYMGDPFAPKKRITFSYWVPETGVGWILWSPGPDREYDLTIDNIAKAYDPLDVYPLPPYLLDRTYDPSNGTKSSGDIYRVKD